MVVRVELNGPSPVGVVLGGQVRQPCGPPPPEPDLDPDYDPVVTVRRRVSGGYDLDGSPMFTWDTLVAATAIKATTRKEVSDATGATLEVGTLEVPCDPEVPTPTETCTAWVDGRRWEVTSVQRRSWGLRLQVERLDDAGDDHGFAA